MIVKLVPEMLKNFESMGESYYSPARRRRTVSDCSNNSSLIFSRSTFKSTETIIKEIPHYKRLPTYLLICVFCLGITTSIAVSLFIWSGDVVNKKQVFLPEVDQLIIHENGRSFEIDTDGECEGDNPLGLELEAASAIHAALEMKELGKIAKAQKLFQHAMQLCPRHADVLTHFGEFFEDTKNDMLMADLLYVKALTYAPGHSKALTNRQRTSPVVEEIDERRLKKIDEKLDILINVPETNSALRRVKREAYFQHLYHTVGIEGNTMSLSQTRLIIETRMAIGGKSIMEHNEILGLDEAMKFINSSLIQRVGAITTNDILAIHRHVMSYVDPFEAGNFRRTQVYVGNHVPPPPNEIFEQMSQLIEWLNSDEALALHPVHYAAIAHYKLVHIHPFVDGNGRTSRLLMNFILMQAGYPPVIIRKQDRQLYYEHLTTANNGDIRPFIRFVADCTEKTLDVYLWASREFDKFHILGPQELNSKTITSV